MCGSQEREETLKTIQWTLSSKDLKEEENKLCEIKGQTLKDDDTLSTYFF